MVNISDSNGEGAKAPSPFARAPVTATALISARFCGEKRFFVDCVWL